MNLKKVAAAVAVSAAAFTGVAHAVPTLTFADAPAGASFTLFDYNGGGTAFTTGFAPTAGNNFTLTYFANTVGIFNGSTALATPNLDVSQDGPSPGKTYEITVIATLQETVLFCAGNTCVFDVTGGTFNVFYDTTPDANNALGTNFGDGELLLSGSLTPTSGGNGGVFAGAGNGSGTSSLLGTVTYTQTVCDLTHPACISPALTGTVVGTQLNLGNVQTTPPAGGYNGVAFTGAAGQLVFQADGQQSFTAVPEPGTVTLFGIGLTGIAVALRRRRKAK